MVSISIRPCVPFHNRMCEGGGNGTYSGNDMEPQSSRHRTNTGASKSGPGTVTKEKENKERTNKPASK